MNLDDQNRIQELDKVDINSSLIHFADQCVQGWKEIINLNINEKIGEINKIVCFGMGGSILGANIAKHIFKSDLAIPFDFYSDYIPPKYVNEKTLAIVVSTSGSTEEPISSYKLINDKTKNIIVISKGSIMGELAEEYGHLMYKIEDGKFNPSSVPRVAVGFQLGAYMGILSELGLINLSKSDFEVIIDKIREQQKKIDVSIKENNNQAKQMAQKIFDKIPVIISSEHLVGSAKSTNNQINESGKSFSCDFQLPDVNHHQLEGMQFPSDNPEDLIYYLIESDLYHERNSRRYEILKQMLNDLGIEHTSYKPELTGKIDQALETFQFGAYMTYYLGLLYEVDPAPNPFVDKFKELLGKQPHNS